MIIRERTFRFPRFQTREDAADLTSALKVFDPQLQKKFWFDPAPTPDDGGNCTYSVFVRGIDGTVKIKPDGTPAITALVLPVEIAIRLNIPPKSFDPNKFIPDIPGPEVEMPLALPLGPDEIWHVATPFSEPRIAKRAGTSLTDRQILEEILERVRRIEARP